MTKDEVECTNTVDGYCQLPGACATYTAYEEFTFRFNFTDEADGKYMRVPLAAFAQEILVSGGNKLCNLYVSYLDEDRPQSSNIILGGMFFQEFFGVFENDYTVRYDPEQTATLYVGRNALLNAYIGNETLP